MYVVCACVIVCISHYLDRYREDWQGDYFNLRGNGDAAVYIRAYDVCRMRAVYFLLQWYLLVLLKYDTMSLFVCMRVYKYMYVCMYVCMYV